ncbi:MAG: hypothetical protein H7255_08175, partial [Ramlibacter sp.]|nr:hypothetical protein [Ramlibacter sp.]
MALSSIQVGNIAAAQRAHGDNNAPAVKAQGKLARHGSVVQLQPGMAQQIMQPQEAVMQGGLPAITMRNVQDRRVVTVQAFRAKTPDDVMQRAIALGIRPQDVRSGARALLGGKPTAAGKGREADRKRYLSHLYAAALLEEGVSEEEVTARLTNTGERSQSQSQSSKQLAEDAAFLYAQGKVDTGPLDDFLNDVLSGLDTTADDVDRDKRKNDLKEELGKALDEKDSEKKEKAVIGVLRRAQGLGSSDRSKRDEQRHKLQEEI